MNKPQKKIVKIEMEICDSCEKPFLSVVQYKNLWLCDRCLNLYIEDETNDIPPPNSLNS